MWGFLPQEADKVAHPGDWFLPKIHTPEGGLRSILGWLHNKIEGKKGKNKSDQTVRIVCLHQKFGFCTWLGSLLWNMSCPGTLELILMGTNSQGTAERGVLPELPGEDCRYQGREHQGCFQQGKCSVQWPSFCQAAANSGLLAEGSKQRIHLEHKMRDREEGKSPQILPCSPALPPRAADEV